jgi:nicotinate-nucleotide adenylyltransferase
MNGSFNPPTMGHLNLLAMARNTIEDSGFTVVKGLFVPTHGAYGKSGLADPEQRVEMCRLTAALADWVDVEPHDTLQEKWSFVVDTLAFIQTKYPDFRLFFVCGADLVLRWNDPVWPPEQVIEILTKYGVLVASRDGSIKDITEKVPILRGRESNLFLIESNPMGDVSSTLVRTLIGKGKQICGLIAPDVEKMLRNQRLYV